jgi:DNA-binding transcriptional LysR family regulator
MKDLHFIECAVALGRHRSFARAAESMHISQPTFSRSIAALEKNLGVRLFNRSTRRVEPTPVGHAFLERAELLLEEAARLYDLVPRDGGTLTGQLNIASGPYPLVCSVLEAVARLAKAHPELNVEVTEGAWRDLPAFLLHGTVDLLVIEATIFAGDHRVEVELLPTHHGCLVCRPGHPLASLPRVTLADIGPYPLVGITLTREIGPLTSKTLPKLRVDRLTGDLIPQIVTTSLYATSAILLRTDGIGIYPVSMMRGATRPAPLIELHADFELPSTAYGIVWLRGRKQSPASRAFIETLCEVEAEAEGDPKDAASAAQHRTRLRGVKRR